MWAGEEYAGGTKMSSPMWKDYLSGEKSLFDRGYDAIGFYAHLKNSGANVWKLLDSIMKTASKDSDALFNQFVKSAGDSFLTNWASGLARKSGVGEDWNTTGAGVTADKRLPYSIAVIDACSTAIGRNRLPQCGNRSEFARRLHL